MEGNVWSSDPHLDAMCSMVLKVRANYEEDFVPKEKLTKYFEPDSSDEKPPIIKALLTDEPTDVQ
uniref:Uncharacterized protein n=1 Tax=Romanomermis culicivorax TaxID=13658 RepID=A0A915LA95_ROMCU